MMNSGLAADCGLLVLSTRIASRSVTVNTIDSSGEANCQRLNDSLRVWASQVAIEHRTTGNNHSGGQVLIDL